MWSRSTTNGNVDSEEFSMFTKLILASNAELFMDIITGRQKLSKFARSDRVQNLQRRA